MVSLFNSMFFSLQLTEVPEFSFDGRSHVQYQVGWSLPARHTSVQLQVRTHVPSGVLLSLLSQEQNEYLSLEVSHRHSACREAL